MNELPTEETWSDQVASTAETYQAMRHISPPLYQQMILQYGNMAEGGRGGRLGFVPDDWPDQAVNAMQPVDSIPTLRDYNYPGYPNEFFFQVLQALGEI
jgi:hypothetical protein